MSFKEAIEKFIAWRSFTVKPLTNRGDVYDLRIFCLFMRNCEIEKIGLEDVISYLDFLKDLGWDKNSLIQKVSVLKKVFKFYKDQGLKVLSHELIPVIKYEHRIAKVIDEASHNKLLATLKTNLEDDLRNRLLLMMLWDTGARNGEILSLNIEDIDTEKKEAVIRSEKSRGGSAGRPFRQIMWTDKTNEVLKRWLQLREKRGPLFISVAYSNYGGRLKTNGLCGLLRRLAADAGMDNFNPHSYRHHMAHDILEKTGNIVKVAKILGHADARSSLSYLHLNDKELEETYRFVKGD